MYTTPTDNEKLSVRVSWSALSVRDFLRSGVPVKCPLSVVLYRYFKQMSEYLIKGGGGGSNT